ncbi:hypothetical protein EMIHUDRAFT_233731 [Emiliania huxleyi CCMP1516]|uniref:Uncharacterized protein n=2 Tax=Emiliania huxleyi TaxID=2903 RepID=A0A0D3K1L1_EMIH1|nr:hypothetical protein EMIHUDRAFT_233731 [Emiliania huxleyi CCMP1516]EOD29646.1 hypothetical protein EMIHUDRAFT_233731 [Emiliania huxleyi CCMP1516]|eukprot:XP_005782075.1 hypothetical protein EMIHUDRAFT_233731 [Emiliania huxleyi CCMP1516]
MLWFPDLTQHDPYYMLPVLSGLSLLAYSSTQARAAPALDPLLRRHAADADGGLILRE